MSTPDADLAAFRLEVAASHGLPSGAAAFLIGTTTDAIESSAAAFSKLVGDVDDRPEPRTTEANLLATARTTKAQRQAALRALFAGPTAQPRDETGRFVSTGGFDGGARRAVPVPVSPEQAHGALLAELLTLRRIFGGSNF